MKIYPQFCSITSVVLEKTRKVLQSALPVWAAKLDQSKRDQSTRMEQVHGDLHTEHHHCKQQLIGFLKWELPLYHCA